MTSLEFSASDLIFRRIEKVDLLKLQEISRITFQDTFGWYNTSEDMNHYLNVSLSLEKLTEEFNQDGTNFYFVEYKSKVIAFLKLNSGTAQTEKNLSNSLEIERIYILKDFQSIKIGSYLLEKTKQIVSENKFEYIWLAVWEKNEKAIKFYEKQGFEFFGEHDFVLGSDVQKDYLMKLK